MIPVMCVVQQDQITADVAQTLKSAIGEFTQQSFGADAEIAWIEIPAGSGFTTAKPSTTLIASMHANRPLPQDVRVPLLKQLGEICMDITGLSTNEVVTSIRDPQ